MPTFQIEPLRIREVECVVRGYAFGLRMATADEADQWVSRPLEVTWRGIETSAGLLRITVGRIPVGNSPEDDYAVALEMQLAAEYAAGVLSQRP